MPLPASAAVARNKSTISGKAVLHFSGYNYLGMSGHPAVHKAAHEAIDRYGTSCSASRIISGNKPLHEDLEHELAT